MAIFVIGQEFRQARDAGWYSEGGKATIVGNDGLNDLYVVAANVFDLEIAMGDDDVLIRGALETLAAARISRWLPPPDTSQGFILTLHHVRGARLRNEGGPHVGVAHYRSMALHQLGIRAK